jgi:hypothetical protein
MVQPTFTVTLPSLPGSNRRKREREKRRIRRNNSPNAGLGPAFTNERRDLKHKRLISRMALVFWISSFVLTARSAVGESMRPTVFVSWFLPFSPSPV